MSAIDKTLDERGQRYGAFTGHAQVTQLLKRAMGQHPGWRKLQDDQREALEMTAHKIGRILNGDPDYIDSWHDIIGYVRLVEQRLEREQGEPTTPNDQKSFDFNAKSNGTLKDSAESANTKKSVPAQDKPPEVTAPHKYTWAELVEKLGLKEADECACAACVLERNIRTMLLDAGVEVTFIDEDTGRVD